MAYFSGMASSYGDLQTALVNACVAEGWTWLDGILSKGTVFVKPTVTTTLGNNHGLSIQAGTAKSGSSLTNPSPMLPRIGNQAEPSGCPVPVITFPITYSIFIHDLEVYLIIKYEIQRYMYLAFGSGGSDLPVYLAGSISAGYLPFTGQWNGVKGIFISHDAGGLSSAIFDYVGVMSGFLWQSYYANGAGNHNAGYYVSVNGYTGWNPSPAAPTPANGVNQLQPLISRSPSNWSANSVLFPIKILLAQASSKQSIIAELQHSRYIRLDNYEEEQIITLGSDKWKVYPFHKKNLSARNGNPDSFNGIDHTGTLGWAIRYDGP